MDVYCATCKFKKARVFILFIRYLKYQARKEAGLENNLTTIVLAKYHIFLNILSKKDLDTLFLYQK